MPTRPPVANRSIDRRPVWVTPAVPCVLVALLAAPAAGCLAASNRPPAAPPDPIAVRVTFVQTAPPATEPRPAPVSAVGCADGQREGFVDLAAYPNIAGCSGGWSVPGIMASRSNVAPACPGLTVADATRPACGRAAGDDGNVPRGEGCTVADLCATGWHVCATADEVTRLAPGGCADATRAGDPPLFFATAQSSNGCAVCATGARTEQDCDAAACTPGCRQSAWTSNDVFGCGNYGAPLANCGPLDRFSSDLCTGLAGSPWSCNAPTTADDSGLCEAFTVTKPAPSHGGVLCCRDDARLVWTSAGDASVASLIRGAASGRPNVVPRVAGAHRTSRTAH